jgi:hypothetical protein
MIRIAVAVFVDFFDRIMLDVYHFKISHFPKSLLIGFRQNCCRRVTDIVKVSELVEGCISNCRRR